MDNERILSKINELDQCLKELEEIRPDSLDEYKRSLLKRRACERVIQVAIETVIDICNLIISGLKLGLPSDDESTFKKLKDEKIISEKIEKILINMKGFRNRLVHKYEDIDDETVFELISERLSDFEIFRKEILEFLNKLEKKMKVKNLK